MDWIRLFLMGVTLAFIVYGVCEVRNAQRILRQMEKAARNALEDMENKK